MKTTKKINSGIIKLTSENISKGLVRKKIDFLLKNQKTLDDDQLISIRAMKKYYFCEENFMTIHLGPALDYLIEDTRINNEKNRLIFPIKNDKIKRSKINELNAYQ